MTVNPNAPEVERASSLRHELGRRYVRYPRWGTYLQAEHVAAVGGRERIAASVRYAVLRDVGDLLYVQLTESPDIRHGGTLVARSMNA